jgi:hypothetical protein
MNLNKTFAQGSNELQGVGVPYVNLPQLNSYQREEQKARIMQIMSQPQLKTTLSSSQYMRELREQGLR